MTLNDSLKTLRNGTVWILLLTHNTFKTKNARNKIDKPHIEKYFMVRKDNAFYFDDHNDQPYNNNVIYKLCQ
jgi:hypothetical protein